MSVEAPNSALRGEQLPVDADARAFFQRVFMNEHAYVHRTLLRLGASASDAEDLAHDVFVVVHRKLDAYDHARPIRPWLCAIAARVASDYRRLARNRHEHIDGSIELVDALEGPDERLERLDARALLLEALRSVAEERRALLVMVELDETSITEAALALEIPLNTAYSRLRLAREELTAAVRRLRARRGAV